VIANAQRGETAIRIDGEMLILRPSFAALVAAEEELGPLFALVERAVAGQFRLTELVALFWHCIADRPAALNREHFSDQVAALGLSRMTPHLKTLLSQILQGR
jgi:hypothetical protein